MSRGSLSPLRDVDVDESDHGIDLETLRRQFIPPSPWIHKRKKDAIELAIAPKTPENVVRNDRVVGDVRCKSFHKRYKVVPAAERSPPPRLRSMPVVSPQMFSRGACFDQSGPQNTFSSGASNTDVAADSFSAECHPASCMDNTSPGAGLCDTMTIVKMLTKQAEAALVHPTLDDCPLFRQLADLLEVLACELDAA